MKFQLQNMISVWILLFLSFSSAGSFRSVCRDECSSYSPCQRDFKCVQLSKNISRCCAHRDICSTGIVSTSSTIENFTLPCGEGTEIRRSERLQMDFCCPILTRFLEIFEHRKPLNDTKACFRSTNTCSCEPVANRETPFHVDRSVDGRPLKRCFPLPPSKFVHPLIACELDSDCVNAVCERVSGLSVYDEVLDRIVHNGGLCVTQLRDQIVEQNSSAPEKGRKILLCPDGVTDAHNEPECRYECSQSSGRCFYGHCCPPVYLNGTDVAGIAEKAYVTNRSCGKSTVDDDVVHAFCDVSRHRYVVIGSQMEGSSMTTEPPVTGFPCRFNSDCKGPNLVCVRTLKKGVCYRNPWSEHESEWTLILVISSLVFVVFAVWALLFGFVLYVL